MNEPLSPWKYFWLGILYSLPVIGFIFLIINSFRMDNINLRNHARSYWISFLMTVILVVVLVLLYLSGDRDLSWIQNLK